MNISPLRGENPADQPFPAISMNLDPLPSVWITESVKASFTIRLSKTYHSSNMYCPSCGTEYTIELKYCNRCGANLSVDLEAQPQMAPVSMVKPVLVIGAIITILTTVGFGVLIGGAAELSRNAQIDPDSVAAIVIIGMLAILTMDIFLIRQLSKIISASLSSNAQVRPKRSKVLANPAMVPLPQHLPQPATSRLQGVSSVTEGTTRFFEAYRTPAEAEDEAEKVDR